jgi:hypothetical protein
MRKVSDFGFIQRMDFNSLLGKYGLDASRDNKVSKPLEVLGGLPEEGQSTYLYVFELAPFEPFASPTGKIDKASEVMFPMTIWPDWIKSAWKIENRKGRKITTEEPPPVYTRDWRTP